MDKYIVVCDRYEGSTYVYQVILNDVPYDVIEPLGYTLKASPDLSVVLYTEDMKSVFNRRSKEEKEGDKYDSKDLEFYESVNNAYKKEYECRYTGVHGTREFVCADGSREEVAEKIFTLISKHL